MSSNPIEPRREYPSTYFIKDANQDEMTRLAIQDELITDGMGGVLPEQPDSTIFRRILDVGCGAGGWLIRAAKTYPITTRLVGVDVNSRVIDYARKRALEEQVEDRIEFQVMDALLILEFPKDYFDLVNVRFATRLMRTWTWPQLLDELQRVPRPGGGIRISEYVGITSNDPATIRLFQLLGDAFYGAGHLFSEGKVEETSAEGVIGVAGDLARLMHQYGVKNVQTRRSTQDCPIGTPPGESFAHDMRLGFRGTMPFIRKWRGLPDDYETVYQALLDAMQKPDYVTTWSVITAWGTKTSQPYV